MTRLLAGVPSDYSALVPEYAHILTGSDYALLRPAFSERRVQALEQRSDAPMVDWIGYSSPSVRSTRTITRKQHCGQSVKHYPIPASISYWDAMPRMSKLYNAESIRILNTMLHIDADAEQMAEPMAKSDLGIGAGGSTAWNAVAWGYRPSFSVIADNQRLITESLVQAGAAVQVADMAALGRQLRRLQGEPAAVIGYGCQCRPHC
ncbi:MAG: hypothetical protein U5P41_09460 [Gammaproteobacteria bacterium]|nr:hypothetical protein [Gammaproteobacteria bacterium]